MSTRIAVVGSGIAGLASAWLLSPTYQVTLFEAGDHFGGHTHTHDIDLDGQTHAVDTGFIVYNRRHYPLLSRLFDILAVASQPTTMSFSVHSEASGLEYNATSLGGLFCQRRNLVSPRFWGMLRDLLRFYREAPQWLDESTTDTGPTLGDYLDQSNYGATFRDEHLVPMASALWSSPSQRVLDFPLRWLVRFMDQHQMLQVDGRPEWRVVRGGSARYVEAMRARLGMDTRLNCPVRRVRRHDSGVDVLSTHGTEHFDQIVLACHSDQALRLLADADANERDILGAIGYQSNDVVLHTDASVLPRRRKAWAAWNAWVPRHPGDACTVSYCMNLLQGIESTQPLIVTLNRNDRIDPACVLKRMRYEHPVYTHASIAAQKRKAEIQGTRRTWFAGAWWGWGFHEDGMRSAVDVASGLGADTSMLEQVPQVSRSEVAA